MPRNYHPSPAAASDLYAQSFVLAIHGSKMTNTSSNICQKNVFFQFQFHISNLSKIHFSKHGFEKNDTPRFFDLLRIHVPRGFVLFSHQTNKDAEPAKHHNAKPPFLRFIQKRLVSKIPLSVLSHNIYIYIFSKPHFQPP